MKNLQTLQQIAESVGLSRQGVNKFLQKKFPEAKVGRKWDVSHAGVSEYLKERGVDPNLTVLPKSKKEKPVNTSSDNVIEKENSLRPVDLKNDGAGTILAKYMKRPLGDLVKDFGDIAAFGEHLKSHKTLLDAREKELKILQIEKSLVPREAVNNSIFGLLEEFTSRLLVDTPRRIAIDVYAHKDSDDPIEDAVKNVHQKISTVVKKCKKNITGKLKALNE